jgi:putative copper resistance protein D
VAGFVDVLLRGLALCGQAVAVGGVVFGWALLRPALARRPALGALLGRSLAATATGAAVVAGAQALSLGVQLVALAADGGWPLREILATTYFRAAVVRILACALLLVGCAVLRRRAGVGAGWLLQLVAVAGLALAAAWTSHAAARVGPRALLLALDALHQLAAGVWIGGLAQLLVLAWGRSAPPWPAPLLKRFSATALAAVAVLVAAGGGLALAYMDGPRALLGTSYGLMVGSKAAILAGLILLGALNFFAVRRLPDAADVAPLRLRRFVEVEFGLGATVLFVAASLTSLPPAVDVVAERATFAEVLGRVTPKPPTLASPRIADMPVGDPTAPRTDADRAWSEFNHNVAGLFVLGMGILALLHATGRARWARHWPLVFLGLAAMLLVRNDPGDWPLGPRGFWEGMLRPEVFQHRFFILLVVLFAGFEWMVRVGRLTAARCALLFPLLCAVGGGLLLTHSHASLNLKEEFLNEITHAPLGLLGVLVGWGRWLELRLPQDEERLPRWLWSGALTAVGLLLLLYRER